MQELRQESEDRKKSKPTVGTFQSGTVNYARTIPAFDESHMPIRSKQIKTEIKSSILPDILGRNKSSWNPSVLLDRKRKYEEQVHTDQIHFEIRKGLRDVSLPSSSPNKIYEGVETRNSFAGWNVSVEFRPQEHKKNHQTVEKKARYNSAVKTNELLRDKNYVKPLERQVKILNESRVKKENDFQQKSEIMKSVVHENPDISKEKATAVVHRLVQEFKEKEGQDELHGVKSESFKPDLSQTIRKNLVRKEKHDGIFQFNENLKKNVWSCCLKESKESPGCIVSYKDKEKWQMISF
jgi:hypothetical protein